MPQLKIATHTQPTTGTAVENQLLEFAAKQDVDLLMTSPKSHNLIQRLFQNSVTDQLVERTHIPMIALKG